MGRLTPGEFLVELDKLFSATKDKGSVYVVIKRSACSEHSAALKAKGIACIAHVAPEIQ
jgi:Signal recognition particle 14kD protein